MNEVPETVGAATGSFRSVVRFDPGEAVVAAVTSDRGTTVFVVCLEPDQELPRHPAPGELTLLVIEGRPVITVADQRYGADQGDVMVVPAGAIHALRAETARAVVVGVLTGQT